VHFVALGLNAIHAQQAMGSQILRELPKLCGVIKFQVKDQTVLAFNNRRRAGLKKISDLLAVFLDLFLLLWRWGRHRQIEINRIVHKDPLAKLNLA